MGAFASTGSVGFALGPFIGLQIRGGFGDTAMWGFFAAAAVVGAGLGVDRDALRARKGADGLAQVAADRVRDVDRPGMRLARRLRTAATLAKGLDCARRDDESARRFRAR